MGSGSSLSSPGDESREPDKETNNENADTTEYETAEPVNKGCDENANKDLYENNNKNDPNTDEISEENVDRKRRGSKMVKDQSFDASECIIAIRTGVFTRKKAPEFEISDVSVTEKMRQQEEKKFKEELEKLREERRKREEKQARDVKLLLSSKRLYVVYGNLETYGDANVNVGQSVVDNVSNLIRNFHVRNKFETPLPILEKRHIVLEKKLRRRKRQKEQLQIKRVEATPKRLQQTNPDIAELSSPARALKLANQMSALYDHERKHTFAETRQRAAPSVSDRLIVLCLRDLFLFCFTRCQHIADRQTKVILDCLTLAKKESLTIKESDEENTTYEETINEVSCRLLIKEFQKNVSRWSLARLKKESLTEISRDNVFDVIIKPVRAPPYRPPLSLYLDKCTEISWFSQILNPALKILHSRESDNICMYMPYISEGSNISYVVWPALVQPTGGVLVKGVAMFDNERERNKRMIQSSDR